jgi:molecular chaperone GrpE
MSTETPSTEPQTAPADEAVEPAVEPAGQEAAAAPEEELEEAEPIKLPDPELIAARTENAKLQKVNNELSERLRTISNAWRQQQEEFAATRGRLERQAAVQEELRKGEVVGTLFEPVENLRRALEALRKGASPEDTVAGLGQVMSQFMAAFQKLGLEEVPGKGSRFDPNLHEALTTMTVMDPALDGVVIDVFATGYRIGNRLINPAKVIVGQHQESAGEA